MDSDRLSKLPIDILHYIFQFLSIKEITRMKVLRKSLIEVVVSYNIQTIPLVFDEAEYISSQLKQKEEQYIGEEFLNWLNDQLASYGGFLKVTLKILYRDR